jgi:hypothetical protein
MDLVQTIRKEGSRGGRGDFKWSDVQTSSHRENYLGHSVMAPTGRWARGRDLTWYAKGDKDAADAEASARKEEIRRVKEAENDAMLRALGLPVPDRANPNNEPLGSKNDLDKALQDTTTSEQPVAGGIGYGKVNAADGGSNQNVERIEGNAESQDKELAYALKEYKRRHWDEEPTSRNETRNRSRSRDRDRKHRHRSKDRERRRRSRSRERQRRREYSSDRERTYRRRRSHSPTRQRRHDQRRDR